jgi:hypothetical protein
MLSESSEEWPVVTMLGSDHRVIVSRDPVPATQWVMQRRHRRKDQPDTWDGIWFCQTRDALLRGARDFGSEEQVAVVQSLPDWCPQKARRSKGEADSTPATGRDSGEGTLPYYRPIPGLSQELTSGGKANAAS